MPGKSAVDAIFIIRQLVEKRIEGNLAVFCSFVDLEKAYDRVPREVLYWCLRGKAVSEIQNKTNSENRHLVLTFHYKNGHRDIPGL